MQITDRAMKLADAQAASLSSTASQPVSAFEGRKSAPPQP